MKAILLALASAAAMRAPSDRIVKPKKAVKSQAWFGVGEKGFVFPWPSEGRPRRTP